MGASLRVLVVEDDLAVQDQISDLLHAAGFSVLGQPGASALTSLETDAFALVVVSLDLLVVDPLVIIRRAREKSVPCLVTGTGFYDREAREVCQVGADSVWVRPLDEERFLDRARCVSTSVPPQAQPTILLVDDTAETRRALRRTLERAGYRVLEADRGVEGIRLALAHEIDLVVLDVNLPGLDGLSVCEILKGEAATRRIPILVCTVRCEDDDELRAVSSGADGFLGKPFSSQRLLAQVQALLSVKGVAQKS